MKIITFFFSLIFCLGIPLQKGIAQDIPDNQYFLDWNNQWRQAWRDGDVDALRNMLPDDLQAEYSSNQTGAFRYFALEKAFYLQIAEDYFSVEKTKITKWEDVRPGSVSVLRSSDGQTVWLIDHGKLVQEWGEAGRRQIDSLNLTTYFTFQLRNGQWMPVTIFDNFFYINKFNSWGTITRQLDVSSWQRKQFKLSAAVRISSENQPGSAALWVRVDKEDGMSGFFDNMNDRLIRNAEWAIYSIEGTIDEGARLFNFGAIQYAPGVSYFDNFKLSIKTSPGKWETVPVSNAGFENVGWQQGKPEGWLGSAFRLENFTVEQCEAQPFSGKYALKVSARR